MPEPVLLTLREASTILDPPLPRGNLRVLRLIIHELDWEPGGYRHTGSAGRPAPTYDSERIMALHAALLPFTRDCAKLWACDASA